MKTNEYSPPQSRLDLYPSPPSTLWTQRLHHHSGSTQIDLLNTPSEAPGSKLIIYASGNWLTTKTHRLHFQRLYFKQQQFKQFASEPDSRARFPEFYHAKFEKHGSQFQSGLQQCEWKVKNGKFQWAAKFGRREGRRAG